ncbi:MAG: ArsR/SmtB family transcription factor [Candidatus Kariarchaeaceae archaeon]|jgi:predicted transcriptional regulator
MPDSENLVCDISHPIFDIIENITRRQVLRLIACEHNYGNRIANILNLSTPAVHRHLKILTGNTGNSVPIISTKEKRKKSYSGYKGAEAVLYEINSKKGLFFSIFPNFIHSQIYSEDGDGGYMLEKTETKKIESLRSLKPFNSETTDNKEAKSEFVDLYNKIQNYNEEILNLEVQLMDILDKKNDLMGDLDKEISKHEDLYYEHRVILRAITCLGEKCADDLSHLLNMDENLILNYVNDLVGKNWLERET